MLSLVTLQLLENQYVWHFDPCAVFASLRAHMKRILPPCYYLHLIWLDVQTLVALSQSPRLISQRRRSIHGGHFESHYNM
jgi:hypothetical protein